MTTFFLDLWHDLREKRLWPVAAGLLAAVIAIPVVMLKPASDETVTTPPVATQAKVPTLPAVEVDTSATNNSNLKTFSQRDPFKPLSALKNADSNGNTGSGSSSSSKSSTASSAGSGSPVSTPTSSSPSSSSTPLTSPTTPSTQGSTQTLKWFRYTADISFGKPDAEKDMKGITDLTMLPDKQTAAIVFMGVSSDAKGAVFFIADPAFTPSGEGQCNDKQDCRFVKLTLDAKKNEETFTSLDGTTVYKLKLVKLNREFISNNQAQGDTSDSSSKTPALGKDLGASTISDANATVLPRLLDLPAVASQQTK